MSKVPEVIVHGAQNGRVAAADSGDRCLLALSILWQRVYPTGLSMGGWISKAANVFRREEPEAPQPFELICECGQEHTGIRRARHQHLVCKNCGASLFVLPRDVYPAAHPVRKRRRHDEVPLLPAARDPSQSSEQEAAAADPNTVAGGRSKPAVRFEPSQRGKKGTERPISRRRRRELEEEDEDEFELPREPGPLSQAAAAARRALASAVNSVRLFLVEGVRQFIGFWTPLRLVVLGVFLLLGMMALFMVRQQMQEVSRQIAREKGESALKAVEQEDWIQARRDLDEAVRALNVLRRTDSEAQRLRQLHRETTSMTRLCGVSLFELLLRADQALEKGGAEQWAQTFSNSYTGSWLVVEGPVVRVNETVKGKSMEGFALQFPWHVGRGQRSVTIRADLPAFEDLGVGTSPVFVVFAAPLKDCRLSDNQQQWQVELDGSQGFLWVNTQTYRGLGFTYDDLRSQQQIQKVFAAQAVVMGTEP